MSKIKTFSSVTKMLIGALIFVSVLSAYMILHSQVDGDQVGLLSRGWILVEYNRVVPWGNLTSAGGYEPGGLTSLVVGLPMLLWQDHRAPAVFIFVCHLLAYIILDRLIDKSLGSKARLLFCLVYWLNPWRVFHSCFLWNPNYLFLVGAVHLHCTWRQRHGASFTHTFIKVLLVGLAFQLHPSVVILVILSVLLWLKGYWKPHWTGAFLATVLVIVSLIPWYMTVSQQSELLPGSDGEGFIGRGLIYVQPLAKGMSYFFRYSSYWFSSKWMNEYDFSPVLGATADKNLMYFVKFLIKIIGPLTILVPLCAWRWSWKRGKARIKVSGNDLVTDRQWMHGVFCWTVVAGFITFSLAPTTPMMWQGFPIFHIIVLPLVLWGDVLLRSKFRVIAGNTIFVAIFLSIVFNLMMAFGSKAYRQGGRSAMVACLCGTYQPVKDMFEKLHINETATVKVNSESLGPPDAFRLLSMKP